MPVFRSKNFKPNESAERKFLKALRQVARHAGHVVETHVEGATIRDQHQLNESLERYSKTIGPWARRQVAKMLEAVSRKNKTAFQQNSKTIARELRAGVAQKETGRKALELMEEQVLLIKSIPMRAAQRAQALAQEAFYNGTRASEIAQELAASTEVSESDAARIARTEVARSNSVITQARAQAAGSEQYIWRTSGDAAVRRSHKVMNGKVCDWDDPPELDDGTIGHPGTFPNCRCYPEPFFPSE